MNYRAFLEKRYGRLAPPFYVAVVIAVLIPSFRLFDISIGNYVSHALFVNGLNPLWISGIFGVEWYIADLALFYIMTPILRKIITGLKSGIIFLCVSVVLSSVLLVFANNIFAEQIAADGKFEMYFHTYLILHQIPIVTIGVVLYYLLKKIRAGQLSYRKVLIESGTVTVLILGAFLVLHMNKRYMTSSLVAGLMFGCLFLLCSFINEKFWKKKAFAPIRYIGKHSYGIYCFHQIIINCVFKLLHTNDSLFLWLVTFALIAAISCGVGISGELIEERIRRNRNRKEVE